MPPQPRIEVTPGILQIALKIPIPAVGHLQQPGMEVNARAGILTASLDSQIAVQRISELVRHSHSNPRHEQE